MTQNGPQLDDGRDNPVMIKNTRQPLTTGGLPMVQVRMENGRPQVQSMPNVQAGPPQIPAAAPALSHQRGAIPPQATPQGLPRAPHVQSAPPPMQSTSVSLGQPRVARVPAPRPAAVALPEVPQLTTDQWMLIRHVIDKYLAELLHGIDAAAAESTDGTTAVESAVVDNAKLAESIIADADQAMVSLAVRAEAEANAANAASAFTAPSANTYVAPRPGTGGHPTPAAIAPQAQPRNYGYVARPPGGRGYAGGRVHGNAALAPRRVQRAPGEAPLPLVVVNMDGQKPVVQQSTEPSVQAPSEQPVSEQAAPSADVSNGNDAAQG
jgi:hypothetical protein